MKFSTVRAVNDGKFSSTISFLEYGTDLLTADEEAALLKSYPTELEYSEVQFTAQVSVQGGNIVLGSGQDVKVSVTNKIIPIDENFVAEYRIDLNHISDAEVTGKLTSKELVAQAKCMIFESKVLEELTSELTETRNKANSFAVNSEVII